MEQRNEKHSRWMVCPKTLNLYIYESLGVGQMTKLPLELKLRYKPLKGNMVKLHSSSSGGHAFTVVRVIPTQAPRSHHVSTDIIASRRGRIRSPSAEPLVLDLWINQVTRRFCGEPLQTLCADSGRESLPCTGSS
jgi:hypothetical protein